jgi:hypothetical protein
MKRLIVLDANGKIVATGPHPDEFIDADGEGSFGVLPLDEGHEVHEVELPGHIKTFEDIQRLHDSHTVAVEGGTARLVERSG